MLNLNFKSTFKKWFHSRNETFNEQIYNFKYVLAWDVCATTAAIHIYILPRYRYLHIYLSIKKAKRVCHLRHLFCVLSPRRPPPPHLIIFFINLKHLYQFFILGPLQVRMPHFVFILQAYQNNTYNHILL